MGGLLVGVGFGGGGGGGAKVMLAPRPFACTYEKYTMTKISSSSSEDDRVTAKCHRQLESRPTNKI